MDIVDRLLAHDIWTTRQLLMACKSLPDTLLDQEFDIDHGSLRKTFVHIISNIEGWTDLISERPETSREGSTIAGLLERLGLAGREFANVTRKIVREQRYDACYLAPLEQPPRLRTYGGTIAHVITHNMHHRAQVMYLMDKVGLKEHIEGDLLSWEAISFGWD
jgi:uncharacterized damage-inducible protein DinB